MKKEMISLLVLLGTVALFYGCNPDEKMESQTSANTLIINLTSDATVNAHGSLMGIHLAEKALENRLDVIVFLNVNGVKLYNPEPIPSLFMGKKFCKPWTR